MNEINETIRKFGVKSVLLAAYMKLADEMIEMPTENYEQCTAKTARANELESLYAIATGK